VFALVLGRWFGLSGVAAATALSAIVTSIPVGARLLATRTGITAKSVLGSLMLPWAGRALPGVLAAFAVGWAASQSHLPPIVRTGAIAMVGSATLLIVGIPVGREAHDEGPAVRPAYH